jgi:hypothetical protein
MRYRGNGACGKSPEQHEDDPLFRGAGSARLNSKGEVVGFDIDQASHHLDLTTLETIALPLRAT